MGERNHHPFQLTFLEGGFSMKRMGMLTLLAPVVLMVAACLPQAYRLDVRKMPGADLSHLETVYVWKRATDERGLDQLLADQLTRMGFFAASGASEMPPSPVDAIVTYQDGWSRSSPGYGALINVQIRDGQTRKQLAIGHLYRAWLVRKSPEEMVEEVLTEIFKGDKK